MMSRGTRRPSASGRYPVSIGCAIVARISTTSPRRACRGTWISARTVVAIAAARAGPPSMHAASVTRTSTACCQTLPSLSARQRDDVLRGREANPRRHLGAAVARPEVKRTTSSCGLRSVKTAIARTWSAAVIGLSTLTVIGTALPFSTSGAISRRTRPARGGAAAPAHPLHRLDERRRQRCARRAHAEREPGAPASTSVRRRSVDGHGSDRAGVTSASPEGDDVLDLLRVEDRLAAPAAATRSSPSVVPYEGMIVAGLKRRGATRRSRSSPASRRVPTPARLGARVPACTSSTPARVAEHAQPRAAAGDDRRAAARGVVGLMAARTPARRARPGRRARSRDCIGSAPPHVAAPAPVRPSSGSSSERQVADALAGRGEDRVQHRRRGHRDRRLADAAPEASRGDDDRLDLRHLRHPQHRVVVEVGLLDAPSFTVHAPYSAADRP